MRIESQITKEAKKFTSTKNDRVVYFHKQKGQNSERGSHHQTLICFQNCARGSTVRPRTASVLCSK